MAAKNKTKEDAPMRRRRLPEDYVEFKATANFAGLPLQWKLATYAERLIGKISLNGPALPFLLSVISPFGRESVLSVVLTGFDDEQAEKAAAAQAERLDRSDPSELAEFIQNTRESPANHTTDEALEERLREFVSQALANAPHEDNSAAGNRLRQLQEAFALTAEDVEILFLTLCYYQYKPLEVLCDSTPYPEKLQLVALLTGLPLSKVQACSSRQGRLCQCGIMEPLDVTMMGSLYKLDQGIQEYLLGVSTGPLLDKYCQRVTTAQYAPELFGLPPRTVAIVAALLSANRPCHILLHGPPGTGKTEFAKAIVTARRKTACFVSQGEQGRNKDRGLALEATVNTTVPAEAVVVVDEADGFLNSRYAFLGLGEADACRKGWLNDFLERSTAQIIWITNDISCIEESTLRRFAHSVQFRRCPVRLREQVWQEHLKEHPLRDLIDAPLVSELAREYRVNAAGIAAALAAVKDVIPAQQATREIVRDTLRELLASHEKLTGQRPSGRLAQLGARYDPEAVHTDVPLTDLIQTLQTWAAQPRGPMRPPVNLLFWGLPGTGKTAFAQHLAGVLGTELLIKRASDLLSMWVGVTEQLIRDAFEEAEHEDAILLLDEADSFFTKRETAVRSWEVTRTNELLTQMENHHGILICCTNLVESLDHAAMRRFGWKVKFLPLRREARLRVYVRYFGPVEQPLPEGLGSRIERLEDLTAGDIAAVWQRYRYQPAEQRDHAAIIQALEQEVASKRKAARIGFRPGY